MKCDKCGYSDNGSGDWAHACGPVAIQRAPVMNERIKQLAEQADGVFIHKLITGAKQYTFLEKDLEKFAELIVQECLNEIQSLLDCNTQVDEFEQGVYNGLDMAKDCIKEHFGVEE